jgi:hypothetical protein
MLAGTRVPDDARRRLRLCPRAVCPARRPRDRQPHLPGGDPAGADVYSADQSRTSRRLRPPRRLSDVPKLMADWQVFWRIDGHLAAEGFAYRECGRT